jgi:PAS domain S-box-containing protein
MAVPQIMVVEDEPGVRKTIEHTLKNLGYGVSALAVSGEEALEKADETRPDLVLMDIVLNGKMDGIETARRIRERFDIPVIYLTGSADDKTLKRAKPTDPFGYVLKPFREQELYTAIELALYKCRIENRVRQREAWFKTTLRCIGDGVIATDTGREVTYINPVAELLTGWEEREVLGKPLATILHLIDEETRMAVAYPDFERLNQRLPFGPEQHAVLVGRNGREIPIEGSTGSIQDDQDNCMGVVLVFRDITHRRSAERALRQFCEELEGKVWERTAELMKANQALRAEVAERQLREEDLKRSESESKRLAQENAVMAEIGRIISSTLLIEEVYDRFVREVSKLIPFDGMSVNLVDVEEDLMTFTYVSGIEVPGRRPGDRVILKGSLAETVVTTRSGLIRFVDDRETVNRYPTLLKAYESGFRSFMIVPLISKDQVIGTVHLRSREARAYSARDLNVAQSVASHIAGAVANAQLFAERKKAEQALRKSEEEANRLAQENAIIAEIGRIISSTLNMEEVYERFTEEVRKLIPFQGISVNVVDYERRAITFPFVSGIEMTGRQSGDTVPLSDTLVEQVVKTHSGLIVPISDRTQLQDRYPVLLRAYEAGFRSFMLVPLISKDEVIGTIHFRSAEPNSYSDRDLKVAQSIASQVAGAVASARLFAEGRRSAEELRKSEAEARRLAQENAIVAEIGRTISSTLDIEDVYERFADEVQKLIPFEGISVHTVDTEKKVVSFPYVSGMSVKGRERGESLPLQGTITEEVVRTRSGLIISSSDGVLRGRYPDLSRAYEAGIRSLMIVPLISKDQVIGTIHLRSSQSGAYSDRDLKVAQNIASQIAGAVANARLYAEHKRTEEALGESEQRMKELFEEAPVGYHELDTEGRITRVNRRALEMFGYTGAEMLGQPVWRFLSEKESEASRRSVLEKISGVRPLQSSFEHVFRRRDGEMVPVLMEERALTDKEGRIIGIRSTQQDITERKRAEDNMAALQEQLRQSQKMEAIGQLAGGIAHDFNNLLTVINGYSDLMLNQLQPKDPAHGEAMEIRRAAERAAALTRQLLAFSRKQILQPKVLDLNDLIGNMDKMLRRLIGEDVHLTADLAKNLDRVKADPGQIEQVIMNIVVNARDAMPSGGILRIETANREFHQQDSLGQMHSKDGRYAMIAISDTGTGMAKEVKERIFEPFFTTKEKGKGTGLGLSTVYGIVKQSGGDIRVESGPAKGTRFEIFLPKSEEDENPVEAKASPAKVLHGSETILLVEDEEILRRYARLLLEGNGYRLLEASNGEDALRIVQQEKVNPIHLLMTDVVMPGMSGRDLADSLDSLRPGVKVLYISGHTEDEIVRHGVMEKRVNFIQKPFTAEELAKKVREVLNDGNCLKN